MKNNKQIVSIERYPLPAENHFGFTQEALDVHRSIKINAVHTEADLLDAVGQFTAAYNDLILIGAKFTSLKEAHTKFYTNKFGVPYSVTYVNIDLGEGTHVGGFRQYLETITFVGCGCVMVFTNVLADGGFCGSVSVVGSCGTRHSFPNQKPSKTTSQKPVSKKRRKRDARKMAA